MPSTLHQQFHISNSIPVVSPPVKPAGTRPGGAATLLSRDWPNVYQAATQTYWDPATFGLVDQLQHCRAGYILSACIAAERVCTQLHARRWPGRAALDVALAREIHYQWGRGRRPEKPCAFIYKCLLNLPVERPEKILGR